MYQIGTIISHGKNRRHIQSALNIEFVDNTAVYEQFIIEVYGPCVYIKCAHINNIIQVKNFVNRISRILLANDEEVDRTIKLMIPNYYTNADTTTTDSEDDFSDDDYDYDDA